MKKLTVLLIALTLYVGASAEPIGWWNGLGFILFAIPCGVVILKQSKKNLDI